MQSLLVSIIIPCKDDTSSVAGLRDDIACQEIPFDTEVIRIANISPASRARNTGAKRANGEILVFIDCDIRLGNDLFLANLADPLREGKDIGITCSSIRIPPDSSRFQIRYAREIPHCESPIVNELTDVFVASSACCAMRKETFFEIGGFNEEIIRGEDSVLSYQLREAGYRVVLTPDTWCYHPQPGNLIELIKTEFRNGLGVCFVETFHPDLNIDIHPDGVLFYTTRKTISARIRRFALSLLNAVFQGKFLLLSAKLIYMVSYFQGICKYRILKLTS
jgi:cellulose synthase/poly-beta-1,6-N-acetylglucosamine synthase-like glycosyltransferase